MHWTNSKKIMWTPGCSANSSWIWLPQVQHICKCILYPKLKSIYVSGNLHMILSLAVSGISTLAVVWIAECDLKRKSSNSLEVREYFVYCFNNPYCQYEFIILELQLKLINFRWKSVHRDFRQRWDYHFHLIPNGYIVLLRFNSKPWDPPYINYLTEHGYRAVCKTFSRLHLFHFGTCQFKWHAIDINEMDRYIIWTILMCYPPYILRSIFKCDFECDCNVYHIHFRSWLKAKLRFDKK